ncbi:hypothetical protein [Corynebacterium oculi]|uniref:DUF4013 domain-containing protein n=1 Tax=Corynebacterium oculi TaxID=1544416 RepID=A0A0Q0U7Z9_9CORY|nr:hypothetical protein [Corynebacterium oculi]KQB83612.1 hypothetical protein Cocul_01682 [Corynebacterium oculi]
MSFEDRGESIAQAQKNTRKGTKRGRLNILEAMNWGFSTAWHNPRVWILGTLLMFIALLATLILLGVILWGAETLLGREFTFEWPQEMELPEGFGPGISLIPLLITPCLYAGALAQVSREKIGYRHFFQNTHYWKVILVSVVGSVFWWAVEYLFGALIPAGSGTAGEDRSFWYILGGFLGWLIQFAVVVFTQLLTLAWTWYVADGRGIGEAVQRGSALVWRNFLPLALLYVIGGAVFILGTVFTLGLGLFLFIPASLLMAAHLCRQGNGGVLPAPKA